VGERGRTIKGHIEGGARDEGPRSIEQSLEERKINKKEKSVGKALLRPEERGKPIELKQH